MGPSATKFAALMGIKDSTVSAIQTHRQVGAPTYWYPLRFAERPVILGLAIFQGERTVDKADTKVTGLFDYLIVGDCIITLILKNDLSISLM